MKATEKHDKCRIIFLSEIIRTILPLSVDAVVPAGWLSSLGARYASHRKPRLNDSTTCDRGKVMKYHQYMLAISQYFYLIHSFFCYFTLFNNLCTHFLNKWIAKDRGTYIYKSRVRPSTAESSTVSILCLYVGIRLDGDAPLRGQSSLRTGGSPHVKTFRTLFLLSTLTVTQGPCAAPRSRDHVPRSSGSENVLAVVDACLEEDNGRKTRHLGRPAVGTVVCGAKLLHIGDLLFLR